MADDVQLTDLEVIQRWSLAVRSASADRAEVVAALRADLAWVEGRRPSPRSVREDDDDDGDEPVVRRTARTALSPTRRAAPAKKPAAKKTAARKATARSSSGRGTGRR
jgi:hypothetical protein